MVNQVQKRSLFITYLKLGYLLHLMTILELVLIISCFFQYDLIHWVQNGYTFFRVILIFGFISAPIFPQCDARSRYQNYKQVKDHLFMYGFQPRIIKPFSFSRCQRDAVLAAAEELGMKKECQQYLFEQGHRWYHLLPEFLYHKPGYLFRKAFWLNTFFAKHYQSKVDFSVHIKAKKYNLLNENQFNLMHDLLSN